MVKRLTANVWVDGVLYGPDSDVPSDVAKQITNPKAWGEQPDADGGGEPSNEKGYADMKAADLKAEIEKRNADREDDAKLSTKGNKATLVAALEADDSSDEDDSDDEPDGSDDDDSE